jgi:hypothetical protein
MQFPLDLTKSNVTNLISGKPIQLRKEQLNGSKHFLKVHPINHKRMTMAKAKGKGLRLSLTPDEVQASGEGFMDILRGIKKGAEWIKSHVIDSSLYQTAVKPIVKELVTTAATAAKTALPVAAAPLIQAAVDKGSEITNAYGLVIPPALNAMKSHSKQKRGRPSVSSMKAKPKAKAKAKKQVGGSFLIN